MLLTEEEARNCWCPMVRLAETPGSHNRAGPAASVYCIASGCMMWRWSMQYKDTRTGSMAKHGDKGPAGTFVECGYCGLAGKPEIPELP